ncbi:Crp/Fnr family transcriptional regulator [Sphingomonas sp. M1-B02]|uniref:Crp/Fnr family transcriptional regulator n=1 Tax=Sphingomonas sp. M1-B02 TaxID=3114300 RepID=UPI00223F35EF|nr:Crp/Fnr family transcriptional regulator [Sphingomonas sp. S6-11]UZK65716.1 Crp/Fnr family transcriptional regulator [Sphingomonas sp. S6-11]
MSGSCFADVLGELVDLTKVERGALERLEERQRHVRRGAVLQRENEECSELFILRKGLMMSYVLLDDGSRQILRFLFPGDILGVSSAIYVEAPETLAALSDCVVSPFDRNTLSDMMVEHPRLAAMILVYSQIERVSLTDRLAALGRTSAKARVAALLLELRNRLRHTDKSIVDAFTLGLTQEEIGDATGLTAVHVNRMLRQLEEEGLIGREAGRVTLIDERGLIRAANYVNRYVGLNLAWLPKPTR